MIGKGGANVEVLRQQIGALSNRKVKLEIKEIRQPELDAYLVATNIAGQLTRRIAFKKAMKQAIQRSMKAGAKGVKIVVSGRLGGAEMGRREWDREGRIPLGTLRADISYGQVHAHTTYGRIGVKVWIYRGDFPQEPVRRPELAGAQARPDRGPDDADAATGQASQGHARAHVRPGEGRPLRGVRRVRPATLEPARITSRQIEAARRAMTRSVKRGQDLDPRCSRTSR